MKIFGIGKAAGAAHGAAGTSGAAAAGVAGGVINVATAAVIGGAMAAALTVGGVHAAKGASDATQKVANSEVTQYGAK